MAEAAVSMVVEKMANMLIEKAIILSRVKGEVERLREELKRMRCFLKDAARKESESDSAYIRKWISDLRKVAHEAEDVIEMYIHNVESKSVKERFTCLPNHLYHINHINEDIRHIRQNLKDIAESRVMYKIEDLGDHQTVGSRSQLEVETRRRLAYWQNDKHVVGLDKDVKILLERAILEKSEGLSVTAVLGMGGIGKSTLARKIYNHPDVVGRFEIREWVVVSSDFTTEDIMKQILVKLGVSNKDLKALESPANKLRRQEALKCEVYKHLAGKLYFIVLDDVWEPQHWESLSTAFPNEDKASRVLLTSHNQAMSRDCGYVHNMKLLDANESWDLFMKKAFFDNAKCPEELKNVGEQILKKCGGLPLAISVVGGLLAKRTRSKNEWDKVFREI